MGKFNFKINKTYFFDFFYVLTLVLYAGRSTTFFRSIETWDELFGLSFILVITFLNAIKNNISLSNTFVKLIIGYTLYFLLISLKYNDFFPRFFGINLISFYLAYVTIKVYSSYFFVLYEKVIVFLSKLSLFFWICLSLFPDVFISFMDFYSFSEPGAENVRSNIIFYTINHLSKSESSQVVLNGISFFRNCGFAWEPGAFATFITLGTFVNLIRTNFHLKNNSNFWILIFALITTFSTTGYSIIFLLLTFTYYNSKIKYGTVVMSILTIIGLSIISLPFFKDKLISSSRNSIEYEIDSSIKYGGHKTPQRIDSFIIDFNDFKNNPILGYGGNLNERWTYKIGANISTISGIGKVFAQYGLVGVIFFFTLLYKSSKKLMFYHNFRGWFFPFLMIVMISISYSLIFNAILMCFWMFSLFIQRPKFIRTI